MSNSFLNWTSQAAIAGRIAECRHLQNWNKLTILGDYPPALWQGRGPGKGCEVALAKLHHLIEK